MKKSTIIIALIFLTGIVLSIACNNSPETPGDEAAFKLNDPVSNEDWQITVRAAEEHGTEFSKDGITLWTYEEASHFYFVQIDLESLKGDIGTAFLDKALVIDEEGNSHDWWWAGTPGNYFQYNDASVGSVELLETSVEGHYIFVVPDGIEIVEFVWPGLPAVWIK